jgi:tight adherence protein C
MPSRRSRHRGHALLHALDLLMLCAAAGLPLDGALVMTDEALRSFDPVLATLLATAARAMAGPEAIDALEDLAAVQGDAGARRLVAALAVGERAGASYADTVANLMDQLRVEEALRLEERAARLPARVALPIIALMVPAALVLTVGPIAARWLFGLLP